VDQIIDEAVIPTSDPGDAKVILFTLVIGALIATVESSGGVRGFVAYLEARQWVNSPRKAQFLAWLLGVIIFIESNITVLVAGSVARPLFDRFKSSREKLAYLIDSTSAPICILIPLNAWGAYNLGILAGLGVENPVREICRLTADAGIPVLVDATQSVAHMPVNVVELGCDFLAFSAHKMYGPGGIGALFAKPDFVTIDGRAGASPGFQKKTRCGLAAITE